MTNVQDLNIEKEILPLFDFSQNHFTRDKILDILSHRLPDQEGIAFRQEILQAFITNSDVLYRYSYSRLDFIEVHQYLNELQTTDIHGQKLKLQLLFSEKTRHQKRAKFSQLIFLFERIHVVFFEKINFKAFPGKYKKDLEIINDFFKAFDLTSFGEILRDTGLDIKHIVLLTAIVLEKLSIEKVNEFWKVFFEFEAYLSISLAITKHGFNFPIFSDRSLLLVDFYHPLLENPVKNTFQTTSNVIILTGPNMSGKSTLLKGISLCIYLGHVGLAVPALKSEMPFFEGITVAINLNDNLLSGYSHFMNEVVTLKTVVSEALNDVSCFAVFDELFRGTNVEDAIQISSTTIKGLLKFEKCLFLISTHLHQLKEAEEVRTNKISTFFIECELKDNNPIFTFKVKSGWSDLRIGQLLFEREGLNKMLASD